MDLSSDKPSINLADYVTRRFIVHNSRHAHPLIPAASTVSGINSISPSSRVPSAKTRAMCATTISAKMMPVVIR